MTVRTIRAGKRLALLILNVLLILFLFSPLAASGQRYQLPGPVVDRPDVDSFEVDTFSLRGQRNLNHARLIPGVNPWDENKAMRDLVYVGKEKEDSIRRRISVGDTISGAYLDFDLSLGRDTFPSLFKDCWFRCLYFMPDLATKFDTCYSRINIEGCRIDSLLLYNTHFVGSDFALYACNIEYGDISNCYFLCDLNWVDVNFDYPFNIRMARYSETQMRTEVYPEVIFSDCVFQSWVGLETGVASAPVSFERSVFHSLMSWTLYFVPTNRPVRRKIVYLSSCEVHEFLEVSPLENHDIHNTWVYDNIELRDYDSLGGRQLEPLLFADKVSCYIPFNFDIQKLSPSLEFIISVRFLFQNNSSDPVNPVSQAETFLQRQKKTLITIEKYVMSYNTADEDLREEALAWIRYQFAEIERKYYLENLSFNNFFPLVGNYFLEITVHHGYEGTPNFLTSSLIVVLFFSILFFWKHQTTIIDYLSTGGVEVRTSRFIGRNRDRWAIRFAQCVWFSFVVFVNPRYPVKYFRFAEGLVILLTIEWGIGIAFFVVYVLYVVRYLPFIRDLIGL